MVMKNIRTFNDIDIFITSFMNKWGLTLLRYSLGIIYIWFGILKPFGLSPAQELVENTVYWFENPKTFVPILGSGIRRLGYWVHNGKSGKVGPTITTLSGGKRPVSCARAKRGRASSKKE